MKMQNEKQRSISMFDSDIHTVSQVKWNSPDGTIELECDGAMCFEGMKEKDLYHRDFPWHDHLKPGAKLRMWTIQASWVAGVQIQIDNEWKTMWYVGNNFETQEQAKASATAYNNFVEDEARKVKQMVEQGSEYHEILEAMDDGHSGFTHGAAFLHGVEIANAIKEYKDRLSARYRKEHL